jgi:SPP1 family predicted phage head-tail adaptor
MNDVITPLQRQAGKDAAGQSVEDWTSLPDIWGDVLFQTGAEVMRANAETSIVRASIRVWSDAGVDTTMRVRLLGVDYDVKSALPDSKDRRFTFLVVESVK